jgi:hypothetical protein
MHEVIVILADGPNLPSIPARLRPMRDLVETASHRPEPFEIPEVAESFGNLE